MPHFTTVVESRLAWRNTCAHTLHRTLTGCYGGGQKMVV